MYGGNKALTGKVNIYICEIYLLLDVIFVGSLGEKIFYQYYVPADHGEFQGSVLCVYSFFTEV
jgi:hypothetical protein